MGRFLPGIRTNLPCTYHTPPDYPHIAKECLYIGNYIVNAPRAQSAKKLGKDQLLIGSIKDGFLLVDPVQKDVVQFFKILDKVHLDVVLRPFS